MSLTALRAREAANRIALEHLRTSPALKEALLLPLTLNGFVLSDYLDSVF